MKNLVRILGSLALVAVLAWRLDWGLMGKAFAGLDARLWALALLVYLGAQLISSLRWQLLARPLGFQSGLGRYVGLYFVGMFFNLFLPTSVGGDVVRGWYLARTEGRRGAAFLSVLAERGSGLGVLIALACLAGALVPVPLPTWIALVLVGLGGGLLLGLTTLPVLPALAQKLDPGQGTEPASASEADATIRLRVANAAHAEVSGVEKRSPWLGRKLAPLLLASQVYLRRPGLLAVTTVLSLLVQLAGVLMTGLIAEGLGLEVPFTYLAVVVPLVSLLTLIPISLNGMGLREWGLVALLGPVGVGPAQAVTLSLLQFAVCVTASLVGAVVYLRGPYPRVSVAEKGQTDAEPVRRDPDQGREGQSASAA